MSKSFASSEDLAPKQETLEMLDEGVYALTAEGVPNVGAIEADDFLVCIDARATPAAARGWLRQLRKVTDKPVRYLVLTHYHAVSVLGAGAFEAQHIVASDTTAQLIEERGRQDWDSELGRLPRLFEEPAGITGLTRPTQVFHERLEISLGGARGLILLQFCGRGHTAGDIVAWHGKSNTLFAGDLVEVQAAPYTGDAFHFDWQQRTLDAVKAFRADKLVGGRGAVAKGLHATDEAIELTREFLRDMTERVRAVHQRRGALEEAFLAAHERLAPKFGRWPSFERCLPFNVQRLWDELNGIDWPVIWTAARDREVWAELQG